MNLIFATGNSGKLHEAEEILTSYTITSIKDYSPSFDPDESGLSFLQNAIIKAEAAQNATPEYPILADDSGLIVDALDGAPGIYSSRFSGANATDLSNRQLLLDKMQNKTNRKARFACTAVILFPDMRLISATGLCEGRIGINEQGDGGFGYDPIFLPDDVSDKKTMAELSAEQKHIISHRGKAFRLLTELLQCL